VTLAWAHPGGNDPNPFQQGDDGRPYLPSEQLVAVLAAGDWLEFELEQVSAATTVVLDASGAPADVLVEPSARGLRVTARDDVRIATIHPGAA
jgi:hypothetical protein